MSAQHTPGPNGLPIVRPEIVVGPMPERLRALSRLVNMQCDSNGEGRRTLEDAAEQHEALIAALRRTQALLFMRTDKKDSEALDAIRQSRAAIAKATKGAGHV